MNYGKIVVEVTEDDIRNGVKKNCNKCPIALALHRAIPTAKWVEVAGDFLAWGNGEDIYEVDCSDISEVWDFIADFDWGISVSPITFAINPPAHWVTR